MRAKDIVGKTIAKVEQERLQHRSHGRVYELQRLWFTDGTSMRFEVTEPDFDLCGDEYIVSGLFEWRPKLSAVRD